MPNTNRIKLNSGRYVYLKTLNQQLTYDGLLEGLPTTEMNEHIIEGALQKAVLSYREGIPHLIKPSEKPIEFRGGGEYPFGTPAALPGVLCEARLESRQPARDRSKDHPWLAIVWFQDEFALPIAPHINDVILNLDWDNIANDDEY